MGSLTTVAIIAQLAREVPMEPLRVDMTPREVQAAVKRMIKAVNDHADVDHPLYHDVAHAEDTEALVTAGALQGAFRMGQAHRVRYVEYQETPAGVRYVPFGDGSEYQKTPDGAVIKVR